MSDIGIMEFWGVAPLLLVIKLNLYSRFLPVKETKAS